MLGTPKIVGFGCFAGPETLARVLKKTLENYILGNLEGLGRGKGNSAGPSGVTNILQALPVRWTENHLTTDGETMTGLANKKITGFFLGLKNRHLDLAVFARGHRRQPLRYTASLEELARLRKSRLH
ncbi:MAG: hypothetical protein JSW39_18830 [Desulfobacterales bacterium]|nr:MAG: hypothetical protein JSW39_18830 [Desulfobacterales bacterium]